jgi:hypothetical protein
LDVGKLKGPNNGSAINAKGLNHRN